MTNEEFEKNWAEHRKEVLANNEEYQHIAQSYKGSGWIDYVIFIAGLALVGMILIWLGYRLIKSLFNSKQTLEELEEKIKQQYRDSLSN